ncbi:glycosyl hydrolase family 28-related protein [Domibacillus robiginosus]|uniref:glycosyl hydrolase family 28-related protein n=1 Tax=Domibacillus robiginosus TaxID=1071054 RepID=UPI00067C2934|nr:glycosyl hydrolase family 28-related protein [Domibacillus robiginosus]
MPLKRSHDPKTNMHLIEAYFKDSLPLLQAVEETNSLFFASAAEWKPEEEKKSLFDVLKSLWTRREEPIQLHRTLVDETGAYPDWKPVLDREYSVLEERAVSTVYVKPGDDIQGALSGGGKTIYLAEGTYIVDELHVPSNTIVRGAGVGKTILKLRDTAPKRSFVLTNENHVKGNHHILIEGLTLDWSLERLHPDEKSSSGNNRSSCLTFANVTYGWIRNCDAINPGLHCYDVSSTLYDYSGDGHRARGGSRFVWIDGCTGTGFGDDGVTTHHSDYIFISNCFMCDPSGRSHKKGISNSNGFEVDDGSRTVWLVNNVSARCFGGVEIKAHATSSAAANVHIIGHLSENDNRSFNFRHIGHHAAEDPDSKTARFITATRIVSIHPIYTELYAVSKPRVLTVSAYHHVVVNGLRAVGDPAYDYKNLPVAGIQYKAKHVHIRDIAMRDFATAGAALKVFGGANKPEYVTIENARFVNCGPCPLSISAGATSASSKNTTTA